MADTGTTIILVSDLHLAAGIASAGQSGELADPFVHDLAFSRWLEVMQQQAMASGEKHRLLLLGDLFDFPRVRRANNNSDSPESIDNATIAKLDQIAAGHPAVFAALGQWLAAGLPIDIVPGNHDFELMRPAVHRHLERLLANVADHGGVSGNVKVWPWVYYIPGLLYAEHGQQYHDLNSFPLLVELERETSGTGYLRPGAALDSFVLSVTEKLGPEVDAPNSIGSLLRNMVGKGPRGVVRVVPDIAWLIASVGAELVSRRLPRHRARRERYRSVTLKKQAAATGIPVEALIQIDQLAETTANRLPGRVIRAGLRGGHASGERPAGEYLVLAASRIRSILERAGTAPAFYVFGHSHRPMLLALGEEASRAYYINGGAWAWQGTETDPSLTFARLTWDPAYGEATASLLKWGDQRGEIESIGTCAKVLTRPIGHGAG